jgi:NADH-quinone oxidoreductase subunit N
MLPFDYKLLLVRLLPETILVIGALIALFLDQSRAQAWSAQRRSMVGAFVAVITLVVGIVAVIYSSSSGSVYGGMLVFSSFNQIVKVSLLVLTIATILISSPAKFTPHIGEYIALVLLATVGLTLLASTEELLTAFISLELTSLSLYLLTAFNKQSIDSTEAALKYFLFGSVAAAFTLFGISLVYGISGSTNFQSIAEGLVGKELSPLLIIALVQVAIGFGFKLAAAPLHLWAPDAYQGAPVPSAALIASGSKLASLVLFMKFFVFAAPAQAGSAGFGNAVSGWSLAIAVLAAASMVVGNLLAIVQSNVRRLIAYSAIAHGGYVLVAVLASTSHGFASAVYYMVTYGFAVIGIFGVIGLIENEHGRLSMSEMAGLSRRSPALSLCLLVFVLSLAGIPPLSGFFGKFYVFLAALDASRTAGSPGLLWIVILAIAMSAVSLYYYLLILKQAFVVESETPPLNGLPFLPRFVVSVLAIAVILLGCFPNILLDPLHSALKTDGTPNHELTSASP